MELTPDLDAARRFLAGTPVFGRVLLCAVTGSHQYGFAFADSDLDLDLKGLYAVPIERWLGIGRLPKTCDRLEVSDGVECDRG